MGSTVCDTPYDHVQVCWNIDWLVINFVSWTQKKHHVFVCQGCSVICWGASVFDWEDSTDVPQVGSTGDSTSGLSAAAALCQGLLICFKSSLKQCVYMIRFLFFHRQGCKKLVLEGIISFFKKQDQLQKEEQRNAEWVSHLLRSGGFI